MILFFFVAVLLVIAGTYLLFTAGSVTLLKALRKNRRYYYKPDHFISVSGMIYRMKQNAVGLANVCILSTMVLVMVFSTLSLWLGMEDTLNSCLRSDIDVRSASTDVSALEAPWMRRSGRRAPHERTPGPTATSPSRPCPPRRLCQQRFLHRKRRPHCQPRHLPGDGRGGL